jgi:hypothetical protein
MCNSLYSVQELLFLEQDEQDLAEVYPQGEKVITGLNSKNRKSLLEICFCNLPF